MSYDGSINGLLASYPRTRAPLHPRQIELYETDYLSNRSGRKGLSRTTAKLESWMHRTIASVHESGRVLELGAGTLNHVPYEPTAKVYDVVEPFRLLWENSPHRTAVSSIYGDLTEIGVDRRYDRIVSIAVLEHLTDLPWVVARCGLLLAEEGRLQAGIPSEGGFLWGLAWRSTTGLAYRLQRGMDYGLIMRHEHVSKASEILSVLQYFFSEVSVKRFPLPWLHMSFYTYLQASRPILDRCARFPSPESKAG